MSIQDDMYDVAARVKGTTDEEAFERFSSWAGEMEVNLELVLNRYNILIDAFKLIKDKDEINIEFEKLDKE